MKYIYALKSITDLEEFLEKLLRIGFGIWHFSASLPGKKGYWCNRCNKSFKKKDLVIHHVTPVKKRKDCASWDEFISMMYSPDLECLCKSCHPKRHKEIRHNIPH